MDPCLFDCVNPAACIRTALQAAAATVCRAVRCSSAERAQNQRSALHHAQRECSDLHVRCFWQGNVANFVETEQLVEVEGPKGAAVSSYVQVRSCAECCADRLLPEARLQPM